MCSYGSIPVMCSLEDKIEQVIKLHPQGDQMKRSENKEHFVCMAMKLDCNIDKSDPKFMEAHNQCEQEGKPFYSSSS